MSAQPAYFESIRSRAEKRWEQLEADPELAGPWHQLFKQVRSPRHILSELLQNADDAGATEASARIEGGAFVFEHDGEDFSEDHFASLCRFGYSNKRALHTIGFRGIGFKSTFSLGDRVELYTPSLSVAFDRKRFTEPLWVSQAQGRDGLTTIRVEIKDKHRQVEVLDNLAEWTKSPVSLLFFKNIRKIKVGDDTEICWEADGAGPVEGSHWLALNGDPEQRYLLVRSKAEAFPDEALNEIRDERMLGADQDMDFPPCQIEIVLGVEGRLFVVLPTGVETALPFAINGPFIQDPTRYKIKSVASSPTNRWLLERAGRLAAEVLVRWLQHPDLPLADRARAYDIMPDVDRSDTSLEGACAKIVKEAFEEDIQEREIALTEGGECVASNDAIIIPPAIFDAWPQEQAISFFDEERREPLAHAISKTNLEKILNWNIAEEISSESILEVLEKRHLPQPESWRQLQSLWGFVAETVQDYRYCGDATRIGIVPVQGKKVLYPASEVVRLGEQRIVPYEDDWKFLGDHLSLLNQNWLRFLTRQKRVADDKMDKRSRKELEAIEQLFKDISLYDTSDTSTVIQTVANSFFKQDGIKLADAIRLSQIAAKLGARVGSNFRYVSQDKYFRNIEQTVLYDSDGSLDLLLPEDWVAQHILHSDYGKNFDSCTREEWESWVANGRSGLAIFVPFEKSHTWQYNRKSAEDELARRAYQGRLGTRYSSPYFKFEDFDFAEEMWEHWEALEEEIPSVWGQIVERLLSAPRQLSTDFSATVIEHASNGHSRRAVGCGVNPDWIMRLRDKPCLRDTHGMFRKPTELLMRSPETEALMDVESFVHKSLDSDATQSLLKMLGVSDAPTGPEKLIDRLKALSHAKSPPAHEVEKWYRRLDQLLDGCSTETLQSVRDAFRDNRLTLSDQDDWENAQGVFLGAGDEDIPDAPLIRASVRDLTLWRKIGVGDRPTVELILKWLTALESEESLSADDSRRVRGLIARFPIRIWNECGHWLTLAEEWVPTSAIEFGISRQTVTHWCHLHQWVKNKTADLRGLCIETVEDEPFCRLPPLAAQIEEKFSVGNTQASAEPRPWLRELGLQIARIKIDDATEASRVHTLGRQLSMAKWVTANELETVPYIDGKPAGTLRRADVLWLSEELFVEKKPVAKLAKSVAQEIGKAFRRSEIVDAIKLCFEHDANFIRSFMEENFELLPEHQLDGAEAEELEAPDREQPDAPSATPVNDEDSGQEDVPEPDEVKGDAPSPDDGEADFPPDTTCDEDDEDVATGDEVADKPEAPRPTPRKPREVKPHIVERFALSMGFRKDGDGSFFNDDGIAIVKANGSIFAWEQLSATGDVVKHYWAKDHCLEREPLEIDASIWGMLERSQSYVLILSDPEGKPIEVSGEHLLAMREQNVLALHPSTYRMVIEHDKEL